MRKNAQSILSGFLVLIVLFVVAVPAYAAETEYVSKESFWNWLAGSGDVAQSILSHVPVIGSKNNVCASSEDGYHHADSVYAEGRGGYFDCICKYCGTHFTAYEKDVSAAYTDYVQTLPANNINSQGLSEFYITGWTYEPSSAYFKIVSSLPDYPCVDSYHSDGYETFIRGYSGTFSVPRSGEYLIVFPKAEVSQATKYVGKLNVYITGADYNGKELGNCENQDLARSIALIAGKQYTIKVNLCSQAVGMASLGLCSCRIYRPYIKGVRALYTDDIPAEFDITTRPTSITGGNYGVVGDNNEITKVENNSTIINETNNTYYNPATGATAPIVDWSYDYSDRSYKVTLENGDTATVTYGDENISITENTTVSGDTVTNNYTIYYLVDGSGETPTDCPHNWTETSTTPAACTVPGSRLLTCSLCSQTKTEPIPALGHDWQVKQTVTTQYDETGQLTQEGYTIYECSRCKEQYKAASGSGPPVSPSDPDVSDGGVFSGIFGLLVDFLSFFWKTFKDFTSSGVKAFLDSLKDGTSDIFGLLNPFDWSA